MFLKKLLETEKQAFLCLANLIMKADGVIAEREMEIINRLREEMKAPNLLSNLTEAESYKILASSKRSVKRAVYLELSAIAKADGFVDPNEEKYMKNILSQLGLSEVFAKNVHRWLDAYYKLLEKGVILVERGKKKTETP